VQKRLKITIDH